MNLYRILVAAFLVFAAHTAHAIPINYELTPLGGTSYRYDYTIANDGSLGPGVAVEWFAILFDPALYDESTLAIVTADPPASDWDELVLASGFLIDAAYDVFALSGGIAPGEAVSGFSIEFSWLGIGMPGAQQFEIYDIDTFDVLATGSTRTASTAVPEPGSLALALAGAISGMATLRRRRQAA